MGKHHSNSEGKEMFYLTMHSTHFTYIYMGKDHSNSEGKEWSVLFNNTLNTFYLQLYGQGPLK